MALSYVTYSATGGTNYSVPFGYISTDDVAVYVDGVLQAEPGDYTWFNATTIQFKPGSTPTPGQAIVIRRTTQNTSRLVDFQDAGNLTERDLDLSADQQFYLTQESIDQFNDLALTLDVDNKWDAENHIIKNVADPVSAQDAVTLNYIDSTWTVYMDASVAAAAASAAAAAISASDAADSLTDCITYAGNALASASSASNSVTYAAEWANKAEDSLVSAAAGGDEVDDYSALHWANKAAASAAVLNLPDPITALQFLRGNAGGTAWEQYNLFGSDNNWTGNNSYTKTIQVTGQQSPASGSGVELLFFTGEGYVQAFNRTSPGYLPLNLDASLIRLRAGGGAGKMAYLDAAGSWLTDGSVVAALNVTSNNGSVYSNASSGNVHFWLMESGVARGIFYYDVASNSMNLLKYRESDAAPVGQLTMEDNGHIFLGGGGTSQYISMNNLMRIEGGGVYPTSGAGLMFEYTGSTGQMHCYDYGAGTYRWMYYKAHTHYFNSSTHTSMLAISDGLVQCGAATTPATLRIHVPTGNTPALQFYENSVHKAEIFAEPGGHALWMRKFDDATGATPQSQILLYDTGTILLNNIAAGGAMYLTNRVTWNGPSIETYGVRIAATGTKNAGHANFSTSRVGLGHYRVTHNLGLYPWVTASIEAAGTTYLCSVAHVNTSVFDIYVNNTAGTSYDAALTVSFGPCQ